MIINKRELNLVPLESNVQRNKYSQYINPNL